MMKRGMSSIIAAVLMILIAIVAISIVWVFVQPSIIQTLSGDSGGGAFGRLLQCSNIDLKAVECNFDEQAGLYSVRVQRGAGSINLTEIKLEIEDLDGRRFIISNDTVPGEFGFYHYIFNASEFTDAGILRADVAGIINGNACGFSNLPVSCSEGALGFGGGGGGVIEDGCRDINFVYLDDFNQSTCTRTRFGLLDSNIDKIPSAGVRVIGTDWNANRSGASYGRNLVQWYTMYDSNGNLKFDALDTIIAGHKGAGLKIILTLRANHPEKSEVGFDPNSRTLFQPDSYPKNEQEWLDYILNVTDRYYVNPAPEHEGVLIAVQIGNEWGHQFEVNESYGRWRADEKEAAILKLQNISYNAIKNIAPALPVVAFATSGTPNFALGAGYHEDGWKYDGTYYNSSSRRNGVIVVRQQDINPDVVSNFKGAIINGSPFYDYFDAHIYFQNPEEARYVANFIRDTWRLNGIAGKGLISTEFANPIYNYSYDHHSYSLKMAQAVAYHSGFDSIVWGNWNPSPASPNLLQSSLKRCSTNLPSCYLLGQIGNYTELQGLGKDFNGIRRNNSLFTFSGSGYDNDIDLGVGMPAYPSLYQCSDGLDNDNDGLADSQDPDCYDYYNINDPSRCDGQKRQTATCIDPEGFSETTWIFTF